MRAVIIEDESLVARDLKKLLGSVAPDMEVLALLPSLSASRKWFSENREPDVLFMDIQLSDGVSFDLFKDIQVGCPIIFTTAYDEYAIRAFKLNSIDYLLKPIDKTDLAAAIEKLKRYQGLSAVGFKDQINSFLKDILPHEGKKYKERFMVHHGKSLVPIVKHIVSCFAKEELIFLYDVEGEKYLTDYSTMDSLEDLLDPAIFFRANRQYIIHIDAITQVKPHFSGKVIISLKAPKNIEIDISREKAAAFRQWLG